jgi:hypothetical protein
MHPTCSRSRSSLEETQRDEDVGVDELNALGHEADGRVGDETTLVLLKRLLARAQLR